MVRKIKRWEARKVLEELGQDLGGVNIDPLKEIARIASDDGNPVDIRLDAWKTLAPFVYPRLSATTIQKGDEIPLELRNNLQFLLTNPELAAAAQKLALAMIDDKPGSGQRVLNAPEALDPERVVSAEPVPVGAVEETIIDVDPPAVPEPEVSVASNGETVWKVRLKVPGKGEGDYEATAPTADKAVRKLREQVGRDAEVVSVESGENDSRNHGTV